MVDRERRDLEACVARPKDVGLAVLSVYLYNLCVSLSVLP